MRALLSTYDADHDGVLPPADFCSNTLPAKEIFTQPYGVNRWYYDGINWVEQPNPKNKTSGNTFTMADTYGCSCKQILDLLKGAGLGKFGGHYKFGCSSSILSDFHADLSDGILDGKYLVETVTIPANKETNTLSVNPLANGVSYILKARGTAYACNEPGCVIQFDADFSTSDGSTWVDGVAAPYDSYGTDLLDLKVNGGFVNWGSYNSSHEYQTTITGIGAVVPFVIYDIYSPNNTGNLFVDIFAQL